MHSSGAMPKRPQIIPDRKSLFIPGASGQSILAGKRDLASLRKRPERGISTAPLRAEQRYLAQVLAARDRKQVVRIVPARR